MIDFRTLFETRNAKAEFRKVDIPCRPIELAQAMEHADHFALLDSSENADKQGGFSILAWEPKLIFRSKGDSVDLRIKENWIREKGNPLDLLDALFKACRTKNSLPSGISFAGGAIGYLGYDLFRFVERYDRLTAKDDLNLPDCYLSFYDLALCFDHKKSQWIISGTNVFSNDEKLSVRFDKELRRIEKSLSRGYKTTVTASVPTAPLELESNFTKDEYLRTVEKAIDYIYAGDIYQINLSQRFRATLDVPNFDFFKRLRCINPSYYGAFLPYEKHCVISSSPELFLRLENDRVETRPIKGTRPRGKNPEQDAKLQRELELSPKDSAELSMIVDLERNDIGRICEFGSVKVEEHRYIEKLPTVFHTVSTVTGMLRPEVNTVDLLRATFPGGSITGCPKIRSIQIIDELEPTFRNVYTGSVGFVGFNGDITLNIAIRTLITKGNEVYFQVGGGIVADSEPEAEFDETLDKAVAMINALQTVGRNE